MRSHYRIIKKTIILFDEYKQKQEAAAVFGSGMSDMMDALDDIGSVLRDDKVTVEDDHVLIDDIKLPRKKQQNSPCSSC